jgi:hypothetical protein
MRAPIRTLLPTLVLSLAACVSGTRTIVVHDPGPASSPPPPRPVAVMKPAPAPQPREALEVTLGRPMRGQIPIQTSRPSYVAVFEIVPNQGVTLVQPTATQRRRVTPAGVSAVGMWWSDRRGPNEAQQPSRFVYVVASDQPLRLSDQAYQSDYWQRALGTAAYRGSNLYATMRAISRVVVPAVTEQDWAEDMLAIAPNYARQTPQQVPTARVYCPDGSVREVPMDFADRAICPMRVGSNDPGRLTRGDSAYNNGRRVDARGPRERGPVDRVGDPNDPHYGARNGPPETPRGDPRGGRPTPRPSNPVTPAPANPAPVTPAPARPPRRDEPAARPAPTPDDRHDAKREEKEEKREARDERKEARQDAKEERKEEKREEQAARKDAREEAKDARSEAKAETKEERREARDERKDAGNDQKSEAKAEPKAEPRPEPKAESAPEAKPEKPEPKDEAKAAPRDSSRDDRDEVRDEQKPDRQPDAERRAPGRPSQGGKPKKS